MSNPPNQGPPGQPGWGQGPPPGQPGPFAPQGQQQGWGGQQPPPQQPWGQQPPGGHGPPPPNGVSKKMLLIAGAGALVLAIIVVLVLVFALGGGSSPKGTVESFIKAAQRQDCDEAFALLSDRFQEEQGSCAESEEDLIIQEDENVDITDVTLEDESGSKATVTAKASFEGEEIPITFALVKEDGDWSIDSIG